MRRFVEGVDRSQSTLFPDHLDDYIAEDNPVRVVDVFVDELDLKQLGFEGAEPQATGRPAYHPATLLGRGGICQNATRELRHGRKTSLYPWVIPSDSVDVAF